MGNRKDDPYKRLKDWERLSNMDDDEVFDLDEFIKEEEDDNPLLDLLYDESDDDWYYSDIDNIMEDLDEED